MQSTNTTYLNMTNISDPSIKIGLDNNVCKDPKYFCMSHKIYLSDDDVEIKHCRHKLTHDMMAYQNCNWLIDADEYARKIEERNQNIRNNKLSNQNR